MGQTLSVPFPQRDCVAAIRYPQIATILQFLLVAREGTVNLSVFQLNMEICTFLSSFQ